MNRLTIRSPIERKYLPIYIIMVVMLAIFLFFQNDLTKYGFSSLCNQICMLSIVTFAEMLVILMGGIDMSVGPMTAMLNCFAAANMGRLISLAGGNILVGCILTALATMLIGCLCGLLNGVMVVYGKLQPIIVSIATGSVFSGLAVIFLPLPGGTVERSYAKFLAGRWFGFLPGSLVLMIVCIICIWIPLRRSRWGHAIYAIGGSESSAFLSGINVEKIKIQTYVLSGFLVSIAGLYLTAQASSGDPNGCADLATKAITASVIGGTALSGGEGSYSGAYPGAMILSLILGILIFLKISSFFQNLSQGVLLIAVLGFTALRKMQQERAIQRGKVV